jgi:hypothetical protein
MLAGKKVLRGAVEMGRVSVTMGHPVRLCAAKKRLCHDQPEISRQGEKEVTFGALYTAIRVALPFSC